MIKEKKIISKYNYKKPKSVIIAEYTRTVFFSVIFAAVFTTVLAIHARSEMIKNIHAEASNRKNIEKQLAEKIIQSNDLLNDIKSKNYAICMNIGGLYETVSDYKNAELAYRFALEKSKPNNYAPYYKLICVLSAQEKFDEAEEILDRVVDFPDKQLLKFKTRSHLAIGDKFYSIGKFISASKHYEKARFYYDKFSKKDKLVEKSIKNRIINSNLHTADVMVKNGYNSEAVKILKKAELASPKDLKIKYKLGVILSDLDPELAIEYFEPLLDKIPQEIDYDVVCSALMKASNIAELDGRPTKAKYYRYKIKSLDSFIKRKVIYKNDLDIILTKFVIKKRLFTYPIEASFKFMNNSNSDITYLMTDFVLSENDKPIETITKKIIGRDNPLMIGDLEGKSLSVKFKKSIYTKKELENYRIKIYIYKDEDFKTLAAEIKVPTKTYTIEE